MVRKDVRVCVSLQIMTLCRFLNKLAGSIKMPLQFHLDIDHPTEGKLITLCHSRLRPTVVWVVWHGLLPDDTFGDIVAIQVS